MTGIGELSVTSEEGLEVGSGELAGGAEAHVIERDTGQGEVDGIV